MASLWQKTLFYLGLVDEDQADAAAAAQESPPPRQAEVRTVEAAREMRPSPLPPVRSAAGRQPQQAPPRQSGVVAGRRVEPPSTQRRRMSSNPVHAEAGLLIHEFGSDAGGSQPLPPQGAESEIIVARNFSDAQAVADNIRSSRPVVLDLRSTEPEMVRRLVDFSSGLTYALDGKMVKISQGVILVTPPRVVISIDEQRRLAELGLYTATSAG